MSTSTQKTTTVKRAAEGDKWGYFANSGSYDMPITFLSVYHIGETWLLPRSQALLWVPL
jgi:hypothetical protein